MSLFLPAWAAFLLGRTLANLRVAIGGVFLLSNRSGLATRPPALFFHGPAPASPNLQARPNLAGRL